MTHPGPNIWADADPEQLAHLRQAAWRWFDCDLHELNDHGLRGLLHTLEAHAKALAEKAAKLDRRVIALRAIKDQHDAWLREEDDDALTLPGLVATVCRVDGVELGVTANPHEAVEDAPFSVFVPWPVIVDPSIPRRLRVDLIEWPLHELVGPLPAEVLARVRGEGEA
ncbi:hypothetical protein [Mobilicoccus pelagius]|uniref:Uncharacterized protein n=1 Tax=Mobilicoccus pelagius NBRC 104925 TaxID=1089455 RepID=H5UN95_9MICO|nr:hypothetical protein [Mobilicoccus pelagius]GAB47203.1 hypothetical protein MOPEL_007_00200 [Mobilicoccus pelagius NBRC 104925]